MTVGCLLWFDMVGGRGGDRQKFNSNSFQSGSHGFRWESYILPRDYYFSKIWCKVVISPAVFRSLLRLPQTVPSILTYKTLKIDYAAVLTETSRRWENPLWWLRLGRDPEMESPLGAEWYEIWGQGRRWEVEWGGVRVFLGNESLLPCCDAKYWTINNGQIANTFYSQVKLCRVCRVSVVSTTNLQENIHLIS